jgi:hypothetical protein
LEAALLLLALTLWWCGSSGSMLKMHGPTHNKFTLDVEQIYSIARSVCLDEIKGPAAVT